MNHNHDTKNFEAMFKRFTVPLLVLQFLSEREMYSYEIMQEASKRSNGIYKMPLLYNILNKFKEQGYIIESRKELSESNRIRIYYAITPEGKSYLSQLKTEYIELTGIVTDIVFK